MRILTHDEFNRLYHECSSHLKPVVLVAYYTGMRRAEILKLTWDKVDLNGGFIRLSADMTKTSCARVIPLHPKVLDILGQIPRGLHENRVFLLSGKPFNEIKTGFKGGLQKS